MHHLTIKKCFLSIVFGLVAAQTAHIGAETQTPTQPVSDCSREFLIAYFPPSLVETALKKANIAKDKWGPITTALTNNEKNIVTQVEEKAAKINPNPLKDPQQRQVAVKIFRETLLQIFTEVLNKNGITDGQQIQEMLDDIQQEKARRFADCLDKHRQSTQGHTEPSKETKSGELADVSSSTIKAKPSTPPLPSSQPGLQSPLTEEDDSSDDYDDDSDDDDDDSDDDDDNDDSDDSMMNRQKNDNIKQSIPPKK